MGQAGMTESGASGPGTVQTGWRAIAQRAAAAQAEAEARHVWQVQPGEPIPFNHRWEHVCQVVGLAVWLAEAWAPAAVRPARYRTAARPSAVSRRATSMTRAPSSGRKPST